MDVNVGRLVTWLRIMGYDTIFPSPIDDNEMVRMALREERTIVTRDGGLAERRLVTTGRLKVILVQDDDLRSQLRQLLRELRPEEESGFSRCVRCNEPLTERPKESVEGSVPPYVYRTQDTFMGCPACGRIYWRGTHWDNMRKELGLLGSDEP